MPIYEYQCKSCEHEFEALHKMSDDNLVDCPECDKPELKKLISAAAFKLKGSGWYESDFKNSKSKAKPTTKPASEAKVPAKKSSCTSSGCGC